jgi:hypothetical protein
VMVPSMYGLGVLEMGQEGFVSSGEGVACVVLLGKRG